MTTTFIRDELGNRKPMVAMALPSDAVDMDGNSLSGLVVYVPGSAILAAGLAAGTRVYDFSSATRTAVGSASVATALGTLNADREVMLTASTDCYVAFGTSPAVSVAATDAAALRLFAGERFHLRLGAGITHYAVIRDAADGVVRVTPVA